MNLYKGFIKTKGKQAVENFKNRRDFKSYEEIRREESFAGVLSENTVLIDIDDEKESEILLRMVDDLHINCRVVKTNRGRHFLFQNNGVSQCMTGAQLAVGLTADIKVGSKNSYEVLKMDGKERAIERDRETFDTLPPWLFPIKTTKRFKDLGEGDGRNSELFSYIPVLQSYGFTVDEIKFTLRLINTYVLSKPLQEAELATILRDDAFQKPTFFEGKTFLFEEFAKYLAKKYFIKRINGQLHCYIDGMYKPGPMEIEALTIKEIEELTAAKRREVVSYLELLYLENTPMSPSHLISFKNGIYDIETGELFAPSPEYIITNRIPWNYNPAAYDELLDKTLDKLSCGDKDIRTNLEESVGYMMFRRNELGKSFMLTGDGSNGKSTWLNVLKCLVGEENYSTLDLSEFGDRFSTVMLFGKLANIGDDISAAYIADVAKFRKIVTGETVVAEEKGQPKFKFAPYAKLFFSSNSLPRMGKGKDFKAIKRRLIIIPFKAKFTKEDPDYIPFISDKLRTESAMEYLIQLGLAALKRVLENKAFSHSKASDGEMNDYEELSNPVVGFIKEYGDAMENQTTLGMYRKYEDYCTENHLSAMGRKQFTTQICKELNLKSVQKRILGDRVQVFERT